MLIWIPVDVNDEKSSKIMPQFEALKWALIDFDAGEVQSVKFYESRDDLGGEWVDFVILFNKFENYIDFMNEGMMTLCVREEETIEEIMEAFKFKELDEIGL
jgi:predicted Fe-Mo cluster-binding NifX family protein